MSRALASLGLVAVLGACGGEGRKGDDGVWSAERKSDDKHDLRETQVLNQMNQGPEAPAMFGVRHDLELRKDRGGITTCSCLAVYAGQPGDGRFAWQSEVPASRNDALVVAISGRDVACDAIPEATRRRPSISAVDDIEGNVYVEIEELPQGRPLALGAIVPKPKGNGHLYVRPKNKWSVYGRSASGPCRIQ